MNHIQHTFAYLSYLQTKSTFAVIASYLCRFLFQTEPCIPLGIESGKILESAITASSFYDDNFKPAYGRLNVYRGSCAWTTTGAGRVNAWIQVDLSDIMSVTAVATQGRCVWDEWVESYTISYSTDGEKWEFYKESGSIKVS